MNMSEFEEHRKKALEHQNRQGHSKVSINSDQSFFILLFELIIFGILLAALTSLIFHPQIKADKCGRSCNIEGD